MVGTVPLPGVPAALATGQAVWVGTVDGRLLRIDPGSDTITADTTVELLGIAPRTASIMSRTGVPVSLVAARSGQIWVANSGYPPPAYTGYIAQFDPRTNRLARSTSTATVLGAGVSALAVGDGTVWALNRMTETLTRIRAAT